MARQAVWSSRNRHRVDIREELSLTLKNPSLENYPFAI